MEKGDFAGDSSICPGFKSPRPHHNKPGTAACVFQSLNIIEVTNIFKSRFYELLSFLNAFWRENSVFRQYVEKNLQ